MEVLLGGLRIVLVTAGRAGGLLRELPREGFAEEDDDVPMVDVRVPEESLGAAGLVNGLVGGWVDFGLSSAAARDERVGLSIEQNGVG